MYCSKECQKQAWSTHKVSCRAKWKELEPPIDDGINLPIPSDSVAAFDNALFVWIVTHQYEINVIATATACLQGGHSLHFSDTPRTIVFALAPMPQFVASLISGTPVDSPATGFHLVNALSMSKAELFDDHHPPGTQGTFDWEDAVSGCRNVAAAAVLDTGANPACIGALPGIFLIKQSPVLRLQPVIVTRLPHDRGGTLDEETRAVFEDVRTLCVFLMSAGLVMRPSSGEHEGRPWPDVGTLVRKKKKEWGWEPFPDWNWGRAAPMVPRKLMKTDLQPEELWTRFFIQ
ncbi:uncharacterized protein TRAVEDRAFT_36405 [Trametes versicolor FP-101664 SS1]|uniref:uncharacterized protein n=1 Tax=Trametes versicolor (strain FP-101664) TaxID=717944 RepID=UPI0004623CCC|nr:uncharacterized protein TRAVEDRAFT_36405 [Trametes versicolor FP-101664 SS1]EIW60810.1 hypothetical protein TRAVEDRAFT_36405 [Trametes versicolor FP-101664 SS1]